MVVWVQLPSRVLGRFLKRFFYSQSKNPLSQSPACLLNINEIKIAYLLLYRNRRLKLPSFQSDFSIIQFKISFSYCKAFFKRLFLSDIRKAPVVF
ncbi:hypothetical protein EFY79_17205 [Hanamia caeni]|uniref:Uncharacterized protein n=1 Tax=Hanamia caeni TaxID=2294116 RepID=A0A3M9NAQ9_9BACT|nr:hypothetical protein EFY79_17205 [Hanamia caeni]